MIFLAAAAKKKRDFTDGPLFLPIFTFAIPIMLTGMLQILYNMADNIVVGRFSGDNLALAAVGSTTSLTNLIVNLFMGIAGGAGVVIAQSFGAREYNRLNRAVHTAMTFSIITGVGLSVLGLLISDPMLALMGTKAELMEKSLLYMRIICIGIPASAIYNFGAAVLRSVGDSKTPLFILSSSGIVNVILNLVFVICFNMSVDGVAIATIVAQYISAAAVITVLVRRKNEKYGLDPKKLGIDKHILGRILRYGVPAGIQGSLFSISNIILTSGVNTLVTTDISAKTIATNIEGLVHTAMNSYLHTTMTCAGQNFGAKKHDRIKKTLLYALIQVTVIGVVGGQIITLFGKELAGMYVDVADPNRAVVIESTVNLMRFMLTFYFLCGITDTLSGLLRGLGYSFAPMVMSIVGICIIRILWIQFIFPSDAFHTLIGLYAIYPISWFITDAMMVVTLIFALITIKKRFREEEKNTITT